MRLYWTLASIPELRDLSPAERKRAYRDCFPNLFRHWQWWLTQAALPCFILSTPGIFWLLAPSSSYSFLFRMLGIVLIGTGLHYGSRPIEHHLLRPYLRRHLRTRHCAKCGYDLRASTDRCPECGEAIPPETLRAGQEAPLPVPASTSASKSRGWPFEWYWTLGSIPELAPFPPDMQRRLWHDSFSKVLRQWQGWLAVSILVASAGLAIWLCLLLNFHDLVAFGVFLSTIGMVFVGGVVIGIGNFIYVQIVARAIRPHLRAARGTCCAGCGCDLRATPEHCPECGWAPAAPQPTTSRGNVR